jgi:hypothetical protein
MGACVAADGWVPRQAGSGWRGWEASKGARGQKAVIGWQLSRAGMRGAPVKRPTSVHSVAGDAGPSGEWWGNKERARTANGVRRGGPGRGSEVVVARSGRAHAVARSSDNGGFMGDPEGGLHRERRSLAGGLRSRVGPHVSGNGRLTGGPRGKRKRFQNSLLFSLKHENSFQG